MVGEIMVSVSTGALKPLLCKLATLMGEELGRLKNLRKEVKFISNELGSMKDALERLADVDELDPQTKRWRNTLREISYDIEDIIDDFMQNIGEKDDNSWFGRKTIRRLKTRHRLARQIEEIKKLVCETSDRRKRYDLENILPQSSNDAAIDPRVVTLYENAANLIGMEGPTKELVDLLKDKEKQLKVVSVVGFGGLGKTTLANVVYSRLKGEFKYCAFVPVSQKPDIPKLLLGLLSQLGIIPSYHNCGLNVLLDQLRKHLQNERYLIIIDDIWDVLTWDIIKCAFPENDLGSRVIVTTRIQEVSTACCSSRRDYILQMKPLAHEDSRKLFFSRIFGSEEACPHQLRDVSVEILKKCGGLPLAVISISSMLASECSSQKERWEHVRDSLGSATNLTLERMRQILNLSYRDLSPLLRTCFLYLGMYPEDYKIDRSYLECQWIAEGFISKESGQDVDRVARSCFNQLVNRSLIQPVDFDNRGSVTACRVHDMMLDLILTKSAEENFFTIVDSPQAITGVDYKIRRLSIRMNSSMAVPRSISMSQVRSLMVFGNSLNTPLSEFKFLRVFFTDGDTDCTFVELCKLDHLRYVHISEVHWYELPIHTSVLLHLETLHLCRLPSQLLDSNILQSDGIGNIKSLRHLIGFDLARNTRDNIKGLGELANLKYLVLICNMRSLLWYDRERIMGNLMDALCSALGRLSSLEDMQLVRMGQIDGLFPLSPPPTPYRLQKLCMSDCWFSRVPRWMADFCYLSELQFDVYELLEDGVGILADLPALSVLDIQLVDRQSEMIVFSRKAFPSLKLFKINLSYSSASYLTFQPGTMPMLQRLELRASRSEQNRVAPAGLEHLLALKEISVCMNDIEQSDNTSIESAFRSAVNMHPGNPRFVFNA